jgi:predicted GIY-YIG superfamily endonuclease
MNDPAIHVWTGATGQKYRYTVYMFGTAFGPGAANYILARESQPGRYAALYVGQTNDLSACFDRHQAMDCIKLMRATHVHVKFSTAPEEVRRAERSDLIAQWNPPCNSMR